MWQGGRGDSPPPPVRLETAALLVWVVEGGNTKPRGRGTPSSSEKEERSFDGSLFRQRPPASGQPKAGAGDKHHVVAEIRCGYRYPQLGRNFSAVVIPLRGAALQVGWQSQFPTRSPLRVR